MIAMASSLAAPDTSLLELWSAYAFFHVLSPLSSPYHCSKGSNLISSSSP